MLLVIHIGLASLAGGLIDQIVLVFVISQLLQRVLI